MSHNYYSEIYLHLVWHTKSSLPLLTAAVENVVRDHIRRYVVQYPGAFVHEIGGTATHLHVVMAIAPTILISDFVGKLKGGSSHEVNQKLGGGRKLLQWQEGYGVVSFGAKDLVWVKAYVHNQREHHARGSIYDRLERINNDGKGAQAGHQEAP